MDNTPMLLRAVCGHDSRSVDGCLHCEAADEIEQMRAELARCMAAEREQSADALRCALEALDYCIEDSAELLNERTVQWGSYRKDRQAAMAATLERHRAVAERLRGMLRA